MPLSPALLSSLRELGDLKRIRSAGHDGTIATRLFEAGWGAWIDGGVPKDIAISALAQAMAAARLGDLDHATLGKLGLTGDELLVVLERAVDEVADGFDAKLVADLKGGLANPLPISNTLPQSIAALRSQPRAGVTGPGKPRVMLQPEENHAEHSLIVAVYAGLLAPFYDADPARAFWHGMIHHLHSAAMPDAGFSGEVLLGDKLDDVIRHARELALDDLPGPVAAICRDHLAEIGDDASPAAQAFHAADVIDRVLEIEQHLGRHAVTMALVLDDYGLVHDGPVKAFHDGVLGEVGLS